MLGTVKKNLQTQCVLGPVRQIGTPSRTFDNSYWRAASQLFPLPSTVCAVRYHEATFIDSYWRTTVQLFILPRTVFASLDHETTCHHYPQTRLATTGVAGVAKGLFYQVDKCAACSGLLADVPTLLGGSALSYGTVEMLKCFYFFVRGPNISNGQDV